ncbi:MAG: MarR family winged helix-turn-helix transcriptional regulator [Eubacterium sp.]
MSINLKRPEPPERGIIGARINRISRTLRKSFNQAAAEEGLFSGQQHIILLLKHNEGLTIGQVAEATGVAVATASVSIKRMEKAGLVIRTADEKDARLTKLYLTDKGKAAPEHIREKMDRQEQYITKGLTNEEVMLLSDLLDRVIENLKEKEESVSD